MTRAKPTTVLRCLACSTPARVFSGRASCAACGGLLDPERVRPARISRALMDKRAASIDAVNRSGVWAFREWVLPELAPRDVVTLGEGRAPLVAIPAAGARLFAKQCGQQPTGSFKDLGMTVLVSAAKRIARTREVRALVCASTGDTSAALAAYGARAGIPVVVLLPKGKVSAAQLVQPRANGAIVVELDGDFDACMRVVQEIEREPGFLLANSKNPLRLLGQATVAFEIARDLEWKVPDFVVVPSGNLGNVAALADGFTHLRAMGLTTRVPRLVAAQVSAADPLHRAALAGLRDLVPVVAGETMATAIRIGDPVSWPRARKALTATRGLTTSSTEAQLADAMRALDAHGLFACPHTATAYAGAVSLMRDGVITKRHTVVVVSTASGLKFAEAKSAVAPAPLAARARLSDVLGVIGERLGRAT